jgi:hypothetical protein
MILSPISFFISAELCVQRYRSVIYCVCFSLLNILITLTNSICMLTFKVGFYRSIFLIDALENWIDYVHSSLYNPVHIFAHISIQLFARDTGH